MMLRPGMVMDLVQLMTEQSSEKGGTDAEDNTGVYRG